MPTNYTPIVVGAAADASVFNAPLDTLDLAIVQEQSARSSAVALEAQTRLAEDDLLQDAFETADEALMVRDDDLQAAIDAEAHDRTAAIMDETEDRTAALTDEADTRATDDAALRASIETLSAVASTSGGTASTTLNRVASAAKILNIGGDGTTTTLNTTGPHSFVDGDYIEVSGCVATPAYNGKFGPINELSTTQLTFPSGVSAPTETPTAGYSRTSRIFVASTTPFVDKQRISVTNDTGNLHTTTVAGAPAGGVLTLATSVPTSWTGTGKASIGGWVSTTVEEVALARSAIPSGNGYQFKGLPDTIQIANANLIHPRAFGAIANDPSVDNTAALNAAASVSGSIVMIDAKTTYYTTGTWLPPSHAKICGMGNTSIIQKASANYECIKIDNVTDVELANLTIDGTSIITGGGPEASHLGVLAQNSLRITLRNVTVRNYTIGIHLREWDLPTGNTVDHGLSPVPNVFGLHDSLVDGCTVTDCHDSGITLFRSATRNRIVNNTVQRCSGGIVMDDGTEGDQARRSADHPNGFAAPPRYNIISQNTVHDCVTSGIGGAGCQYNEITNNVITNTGRYADPGDPTLGYMGVQRFGYGIQLASQQNHIISHDNIVTGNQCIGNRRNGMLLFGTEHNTIANNRFVDNGLDYNGSPSASGLWLYAGQGFNTAATAPIFGTTANGTQAGTGAGTQVLNVTLSTYAVVSTLIDITLDNGTFHSATITATAAGTITVAPAIPVGRSVVSAAPLGQRTIPVSIAPGTTGVGGPEFVVGGSIGLTVLKNRTANPNENATEYTTIAALNNAGLTLTLTSPPLRSIANGATLWNPIPNRYNKISSNVFRRTQPASQAIGLFVFDEYGYGNTIRDNTFLDDTANADYSWTEIVDNVTGTQGTPNHRSNNTFGTALHAGVLTHSGVIATPVMVPTAAYRANSMVTLSRLTQAPIPANTGNQFVYDMVPNVAARWAGTILNAPAAAGASSVTVLNGASFVAGATMRVALDSAGATWFDCLVRSSYAGGTTIPLAPLGSPAGTATLPSTAQIDWSVQTLIPATAGSFSVKCTIAGDTGTCRWSISN